MITLKEQLIGDITNSKENEWLTIVEESGEENTIILYKEEIIIMLSSLFDDELIGRYTKDSEQIRIVGWGFKYMELTEQERISNFGYDREYDINKR